MDLINKLNKEFHIKLKSTVIFTYGNVNDLSRHIYEKYGEEISETPQMVKLKEERPIEALTLPANKIFRSAKEEQSNQGKQSKQKEQGEMKKIAPMKFETIFLTGATGILGGYILKELLETTQSQIVCLIRAKDIAHAKERLKKILTIYGSSDSILKQFDQRVIPIIGDVGKENLGIDENEYHRLAHLIDCTIHIAANTNLVMPYDYLAPINVQGVINMIDFVLTTKQKYLIHVSSYHVMADVIYRKDFAFTEEHFDVGQGFSKMGYQKTKFEGERFIREATEKGLVWNIVRPGNIFGEEKTGFYPLDMSGSASIFHRLFEMIIKSGIAAFGQNYFDMTPVDYIAKGILFLGLQRNSFFETYHMLNPDIKRWYEIINLVNEYGYKIKLIPVDDYLKMVHENNLPISEEIGAEWLNLMKYGFANKDFFINDGYADARYTSSILKDADIICPRIDLTLLSAYLSFYTSKGIIPPLPERNETPKIPLRQYNKKIEKKSSGKNLNSKIKG